MGLTGLLDGIQELEPKIVRNRLSELVSVIEQRGEQGGRSWHGTTALCQSQRCMLMVKKGNQPILNLLYTRGDIGLCDTHPHRQGVDEHAEGMLSGFTTLHTAKQYGAEDDVILAGQTGEHTRPCLSLIHISSPRDLSTSRMPSSA